MEEKIIPVSNELAFQFASEIINSNPDSQKIIANYQNIQMIEIMDRKPHINCNITNIIA